jgi:hypothetical protein
MPRTGGVYAPPAGSKGTPNTTIQSSKYNALVDDLTLDANAARPVTAGGTGATNATAARAALGLVIGTNVQAYDGLLQAIAALNTSADKVIMTTGTDTVALKSIGTSGDAIPLLNAGNTWSVIQKFATVDGGSGNYWTGRLLHLENFAPGIYLQDNTGSSTNALMTLDGNSLRYFGTPNTDGTSLTERMRMDMTNGDMTLSGTLFAQNRIDVSVPTSSTPEARLTRNGVRVASLYFDGSDNLVLRRYNPTTGAAEGYLRIDGNGVNNINYNSNTIWHAGNDGSGSTLDSDLLDGQHGTYYRDLGNSSGTLPDARLAASVYNMVTLQLSNHLTVSGSQPYVSLIDTTSGELSGRLRVNGNNVHFDNSSDDVTFSEVFRFELDTKRGYVNGVQILTGSINNGNWSGTDLSVANGGTGASDAAGARTNLGLGGLATLDLSDLVYNGSSLNNTSFPIGDTVYVFSGSTANRNTAYSIYTDPGADYRYTRTAGGAQLAGTWRAKGAENSVALMRRTA